jgi:hypothetical protein
VNRSGVASSKDEIRQTIEAFEECRLSTTSRAEDCKDLFGSNIEIDILQGLNGSVIETKILYDDLTFVRHKVPLPR